MTTSSLFTFPLEGSRGYNVFVLEGLRFNFERLLEVEELAGFTF